MTFRFTPISLLIVGLSLSTLSTPFIAAETRLPNGRLITPLGSWTTLAPFPFTLALRPDGDQLVIPSIGWPFSLNIVDHPDSPHPQVTRIPTTQKSDPEVQVHAGVVYSLDGRLLYDATGDTGAVDILSTETWHRVSRIELDGPIAGTTFSGSFAATLALSHDGLFLYVVDQGNWRVVVIETRTGKRIASVPTGSNPFGLALSPDGRRLHVTNSGLFEYQLIQGIQPTDTLHTGLHFPPFGYPSKEARNGTRMEGHRVPGLGSENSVRGSSLWTYDISDPAKPSISAKLRLGAAIGSPRNGVVGGASPSCVLADAHHVYVTLAHEDSVAVVTPDGRTLQRQLSLTPFRGSTYQDARGHPLKGIMPVGIAQDATRLYVTEAGINALAVIDKESGTVLSHVPVGWFPAAALVSRDASKLYVVNTKGKGAGPNGGSTFTPGSPSYIGELQRGSLSVIPLADLDPVWANGTAAVLRNNQAALVPQPYMPRVKHVFLIIRENRTFDEVFGDLAGADGEPRLARYGMHGTVAEASRLHDLQITPNAHALAQRFGTSDAFFADGDVSADGHRWAVGIAPTPWMDLAWTTGYGDRRHSDPFSSQPGRRALGGGNDAPMPEDEPEFGSLWEHIAGAGMSIRNYGEGLEIEGVEEADGREPEGQRLLLNSPVPQPVFLSTDRQFPTFNLGIPDQLRVNEFAKDFGRRLKQGKAAALTVIRLPNDHTADPRPMDGYPYKASYVADNDLALGRIVETISRSSIWKDSAIFAIEDDAQGGVDHVDAHRSVLLVIGPYVSKGIVSHRHSSMPSVQKTIYEMLGLGPLNLEDALAADLSNMFTATPDLHPFVALPADPRVFDPTHARSARPKTAEEARKLLEFDNPREIEAEFHQSPQN